MKPLPTALLIVGAMLAGAGITYWTVRQLPPMPAPQSRSAPPLAAPAPNQLAATVESARIVPEPPAVDEAALDAAIAAAKEARARGELKPVATTPEEFARQLGLFNFHLIEFVKRFPEPPAETDRETIYRETLDRLTREYANLTLDEKLLDGAENGTPARLAHLQAHLAGGSLELDADQITRLKEILRVAYEKIFPVDDAAPDSEAKLDAATKEITTALNEFLTPEQRARLELMGADFVLFGLPQPDSDIER
jgi:hypothetical protein